jgi:hypothetical protein
MPRTNETRRAVLAGAAGLGDCHRRLASDNRVYPPKFALYQEQSRARLRFLAARLHALGPRPLYHFLREVEGGASLRSHLERYAALPAGFILANGGDRFAPSLHVIDGGLGHGR